MMAHHYVSSADRLAREILKAAILGLAELPLTPALIERWFTQETPDAIRAAVGHSIRQGWLTTRDGGWVLTAVGETIGKRWRPGRT